MKHVLPVLLLLTISACNPFPDQHWSGGLPDYTPMVILPSDGSSVREVAFGPAWNVLDNLTPANREHIYLLSNTSGAGNIQVQGVSLFPHSADDWMPIWILRADKDFMSRMSGVFSKPYTETSYSFNKARIYKLFLPGEVILYAVALREWIYISESSLGIEETVRAFGSQIPSLQIPGARFVPGNVIVNAQALDQLIALETAVRFRPQVDGSTHGAGASELTVIRTGSTNDASPDLSFSGRLPLDPAEARSWLVRGLTTRNHRNVLDRFISQDAALAVFMNTPAAVVAPTSDKTTRSDEWIAANPAFLRNLIASLGDNFAFAAFASSGVQSVGEYAFVRMTEDRAAFVQLMGELADAGVVTAQDGSWLVQGSTIGRLLSGNMASFDVYYVSMLGDAVAVTQRPGLAQKLQSDRNRRRVLHFNETYLRIREGFDAQISGFVYAQSAELTNYVQSLLNTVNTTDLLLQQFTLLSMAFTLHPDGSSAQWDTQTWQMEQATQPVEERWLVGLDGTDLSGPPVLANIGGSAREEVLVATRGGLVTALAADGTQIFRVRTENDEPVGSPVVYDWYSNGQMVVMLAAGNKIYAWNNNGIALPNFPVALSETITAPLQIADVTRNGLPEMVVATADRNVHVLDQRGNNIAGWPQSVNAIVRAKPWVETAAGRREIFAYAENVVFAWNASGVMREGFPVFNRAPLRGDLFYHRNHILAGSADGSIVSIGSGDYFSPDFAVRANPFETSTSSNQIQLLELTNTALVLRPEASVRRIVLSDSTTVTESVLFATSDNGSVFVIAPTGALRFTESFGQAAMAGQAPLVADLRRNGGDIVVALAGFGRLFGWDLQTRNQYVNLPTVSLQHPVISDIIANGRMEIIAGTRDGLRCWTINR